MSEQTLSTTGVANAAGAVDSAVTWLLSRLDTDGVPRYGPEATYRLPHSLLLTGRRAEAAAVLTWDGARSPHR